MVLGPSSARVRVFAGSTILLYLKFLVTARMQAVRTFAAGGRPPEDIKIAELLKRKGPAQNYGLSSLQSGDAQRDEKLQRRVMRDQRWRRIVANDIEAIPFALAVFAAGLFVESNEQVLIGSMVTFTVARFAHTIAYAHELQPHRSLVWAVGVGAVLVAAGSVASALIASA
ncbi:hypothetical protein P43SY_004072 [Pythium insidiosum]|uniref:Microsomal glutathione S-transferase 1 n=1 Tax=Pythium insidiosum TaxID=114742 RepID=A0AAD5LBB8_PYTIN|nr:hypothetical protein P43SY_004072 [Pythium insidiosum]